MLDDYSMDCGRLKRTHAGRRVDSWLREGPGGGIFCFMAEMKFDCPRCQQQIACDELWGGHELQCPTCHAQIMVPQPGSATPAEAAPRPGSPPNSLVPQVPTSSAPKLSIGQARHQPMT